MGCILTGKNKNHNIKYKSNSVSISNDLPYNIEISRI